MMVGRHVCSDQQQIQKGTCSAWFSFRGSSRSAKGSCRTAACCRWQKFRRTLSSTLAFAACKRRQHCLAQKRPKLGNGERLNCSLHCTVSKLIRRGRNIGGHYIYIDKCAGRNRRCVFFWQIFVVHLVVKKSSSPAEHRTASPKLWPGSSLVKWCQR